MRAENRELPFLILTSPQGKLRHMITVVKGLRVGHPKICQGTILILLNKSYLRNSWCRRDTLTLLSVPLKSGNASPCEILQGGGMGGVERHPYHQRERIQGQEVYLNKL